LDDVEVARVATEKLPALFLAHGSPMLAVEDDAYAQYLKRLGEGLTPEAIVVFSAHWTARGQWVNGAERPPLLYDFSGFPDALYGLDYPAPGDPALARRIVERLEVAGVEVRTEAERGWDHGVWVLLRLMFPAANIPVVEMSVDPRLSPAQQYATGAALAPLRADGVLMIGSGGTVHNLSAVSWDPTTPPVSWAVGFDAWLETVLRTWDTAQLFRYRELAPHAALAVPPWGPEHFVPLFYAMGAADDDPKAERLFQAYQMGSLSLAAWRFGG
jgi:4,5-DOPA dioxygenase extradiol